MSRPLRMLFVMDPIASIDIERDTTFVLMLEAQRRGHEVFVCGLADLVIRDSRTHARVQRARVERADPHYALEPGAIRPLSDMHAVFMRKDPPYDMDYVYATHLLDPELGRTYVSNHPLGLREATEKLFAMRYPDLTPTTHLDRDASRLKALLDEFGGTMVVKRLDGSGGAGVFLARRGDANLGSILEAVTDFGRRWVLAQRYIERAPEGDKRVIVIGGEPVGAVLRVPGGEDFRGNIHVGARTVAAEVDDFDREVCRRMRPTFEELGLDFVGLDVIGGYVTEVNVTSPTGFQEIRELSGLVLERILLDHVEARLEAGAAAGFRPTPFER